MTSWTCCVDGSSNSTEETIDVSETFDSSSSSESTAVPLFKFADAVAEIMSWEAASPRQQTPLIYDISKKKYGKIERRGLDVFLMCPVDDIEELRKKFHLMKILSDVDFPIEHTEDVETLVDEQLLDVAEFYFDHVGLSISELSVPLKHAKAQYLHDAWAMDSNPALEEHLDGENDIADRLGFGQIPDQSIFWYHEQKLESSDVREKISLAAEFGVYALLRNDVPLPDEVFEICG